MKTCKRFLAVTLCLLMVLGSFSIGASAELASGSCGRVGSTINYVISDSGVLTITNVAGDGVIASYEKSGSRPWDGFENKIKSIVIGNDIKQIGTYAFFNLYNVTTVSLPSTINTISSYAFSNCVNLCNVEVPSGAGVATKAFELVNNVKYTGNQDTSGWGAKAVNGYENASLIFKDSSKKVLVGFNPLNSNGKPNTGFVIPAETVEIADNAFYMNKAVESVIIQGGSKLEKIGDSAFESCTKLTSVKMLPRSLKIIDFEAFAGCSGLTLKTWMTTDGWKKVSIPYANAIPSGVTVDCHTHSFPDNWTSCGDEGHEKVCACGESGGNAPHNLVDGEITMQPTYTSVGKQKVTCFDCNYDSTKDLPRLTCDIMKDNLGTQSVFYKAATFINVEIPNVPSGAEVYICGTRANKDANYYSINCGSLSDDLSVTVEIKAGSDVIESATAKVEVDNGFFSIIASFFVNFLFNGFEWRTESLVFNAAK